MSFTFKSLTQNSRICSKLCDFLTLRDMGRLIVCNKSIQSNILEHLENLTVTGDQFEHILKNGVIFKELRNLNVKSIYSAMSNCFLSSVQFPQLRYCVFFDISLEGNLYVDCSKLESFRIVQAFRFRGCTFPPSLRMLELFEDCLDTCLLQKIVKQLPLLEFLSLAVKTHTQAEILDLTSNPIRSLILENLEGSSALTVQLSSIEQMEILTLTGLTCCVTKKVQKSSIRWLQLCKMDKVDLCREVEFENLNYLMVKDVREIDVVQEIFQKAVLRRQDLVPTYYYPYSDGDQLLVNADLIYCCSCLNFKDLVSYTSSTDKVFIHNLPNLHSLEIMFRRNYDFYFCPNAKNIDCLKILVKEEPILKFFAETFSNIVKHSCIHEMIIQVPSSNVWNNYMLPYLSSTSLFEIKLYISKNENDIIHFRDIKTLFYISTICSSFRQPHLEIARIETLQQVTIYGNLTQVQFTLFENLDNFTRIVVPSNVREVIILPRSERKQPIRIVTSKN